MTLKEQIDADIKKAMLAKDSNKLRALRGIKSMILVAETEKGKAGELNSEREMAVLQKAAKQRRESLDVYVQQDREDLAQIERDELAIIEQYLPKAMSFEEIQKEVDQIIIAGNYNDIKSMGIIMKEFSSKFSGQDGKLVSTVIKNTLVPSKPVE